MKIREQVSSPANDRKIGKCENVIIFQLQKNSPSPAYEFLLHTVGAVGKFKRSNIKLILKVYKYS